jgi:hypothetical protein
MLKEIICVVNYDSMTDMNPGYWIVSIPSVLATPWDKETEMRISVVHKKGQIVLLGNKFQITNLLPAFNIVQDILAFICSFFSNLWAHETRKGWASLKTLVFIYKEWWTNGITKGMQGPNSRKLHFSIGSNVTPKTFKTAI